MAATNAPARAADLLDAVHAAGEAVLTALAADDVDAAAAHAQERGALVARLADAERGPADLQPHRQRLEEQDRALTAALADAHAAIGDALRLSGRYQHAADQYASGAPVHARLQARG